MADKKKENFINYLPILIIFSFILIISLGSAVYFYNKYQQALKNKTTVTTTVDETKQIVSKVGRLMELPQGEIPTLYTINDKTILQNQEFFQKAENGDKVLVYAQAKKAILYRPSINKIIDVAPIRPVQPTGPTATPSATLKASATLTPRSSKSEVGPTPILTKARVVLYNGTDTVGITYKVEKELLPKIDNIEIVDKDNAAKSDYTETIVVDLSGGKFTEKAAELATFLKGEVGDLPDGEKKPDADILVILSQ